MEMVQTIVDQKSRMNVLRNVSSYSIPVGNVAENNTSHIIHERIMLENQNRRSTLCHLYKISKTAKKSKGKSDFYEG